MAGLLLHATHAMAQDTPHIGHPPAASKPAPADNRTLQESSPGSAFAGYRRFTPEEPLKDWRAANEEVRAAGGHIGLVKDAAQTKAHPAADAHANHRHGKKRP